MTPPPTSAAAEDEWCGVRTGRTAISDWPGASSPRAEYTRVVSSDSAGVSGGRIVGIRLASIVLPDPGGPIINRLWCPAAATVSARLPDSWPRTSAKSAS